jgi:hypothetical protein
VSRERSLGHGKENIKENKKKLYSRNQQRNGEENRR